MTKQKVHVAGCLLPKCAGFGEVALATMVRLSVAFNDTYSAFVRKAAQELDFIKGLAASLPELVRPAIAMHSRADRRRGLAQTAEPARSTLPDSRTSISRLDTGRPSEPRQPIKSK